MPNDAIEADFPKLTGDGYEISSERDESYNCVAWAAGRSVVCYFTSRYS